jgi:hypothetical protein
MMVTPASGKIWVPGKIHEAAFYPRRRQSQPRNLTDADQNERARGAQVDVSPFLRQGAQEPLGRCLRIFVEEKCAESL